MSYLDILENDYPGPETFLENCLKPVFGTAQKTRLSLAGKLSDSEKSIIKDIFIFGKTDNFVVNDMNFFDVTVRDGVDIARSRVTIQRAVRKSLDNYQAAIVIFHHSDNAGLWRFSFIYKESSATDTTSARRYSYLCGKEQHCRTAADNLKKLENIQGKKKLEDVTTVFSIEALTKDFFNRLFKWYDTWAVNIVRFPVGKGENARLPKTIDETGKKENRQHLIRLITRLIFVWFLKHKEELIPGWIFDIQELKELINNFDEHDDTSGSYYNAVLQNLFFATLNCEINKRRFFDNEDGRDGYSIKAQFRDHVDKPMIKIPHNEFIKKFETIPFLNGGLFECLDHREGHEKQEYKDGFSRESKRAAFVPNCLFFGDGQHDGIINIFSEYNFTIEENTPQDIEVALDPELLGKVFENLLGTYNEETAGTARKESGSFYTPREIVEYMVDTSLKEYFKTKLNIPPQTETDKNLDGLFSRSIEGHDFSKDQTTILIEAIYHCRILDPACGSGAFPMGILNKLVLILEKLDPENSQWKEIQIQKAIKETEEAYRTGDKEEREERLRKIQEVFEQSTMQHTNYARKLYLIENCIYGVDIQPIAIQISKLRFFISLIVDQKTGGIAEDNYNVLPLPNLETKFVAANTLIGIKRIQEGYQHEFADSKIEEIQKELLEVRHKHFSPRTVKEKERLRKEDAVLSKELSALLKKDGFYNATDAQKMADWNPYGQTKSVDFFDAWWMFGIKDGFDVVIGNPPYVQLKWLNENYSNLLFTSFSKNSDIYCLFYEKCNKLLINNGTGVLITSNKWLRTEYGKRLKQYIVNNFHNIHIIDFKGISIFENATVDTEITRWMNNINIDKNNETVNIYFANCLHIKSLNNLYFNSTVLHHNDIWIYQDLVNQGIRKRIESIFKRLKEFKIILNYGLLTGANNVFILDKAKKIELEHLDKSILKYIVPILRGKDLEKYWYNFNNYYLLNLHNGISKKNCKPIKLTESEDKKLLTYLHAFGDKFKMRGEQGNNWYNLRSCNYIDLYRKPKILYADIVRDTGKFFYDENSFYTNDTAFMIYSEDDELLKYLTGVLNSKAANFLYKNYYCGGSLGEKGLRFKKEFISLLPIPDINNIVIRFVASILAAKAADPQADTSALERQIDNLVYRLYNLTYDEVRVIEPDFALSKAEYEGMDREGRE
jgi:tRNA1(Val) A37 N6-methylase TrmN6